MDFLLHDVYLPGLAPHDAKTKTPSTGWNGSKSNSDKPGLYNSLLRLARDGRVNTDERPKPWQNTGADNEWHKQVLDLKVAQVRQMSRA